MFFVFSAIDKFPDWKANANKWGNAFTYINPNNPFAGPAGMKIGYGQLGFADVCGGIQGGIDGTVLGPGGTAAGAIFGAAFSSYLNIMQQVATSHFSWW